MLSNVKKSEILWRNYFSTNSLMTEEEKKEFFESATYMPYKGCGGIQIAEGQIDKAEKLLAEYIGEYAFDDYYEFPFLTENSVCESFCYGKLTFPNNNASEFLNILIENDIKVINVLFQNYDTVFPQDCL
tara:strand:- start:513 stop:902 length:390 start_codon:yes stop_codon:yes gene_type:complete